MKQSSKLTVFYNAYHDWLMNGAPIHNIFSRKYGLCRNLNRFYDYGDYKYDPYLHEMRNQFFYACLNTEYPFGEDRYYNSFTSQTAHLDPNRIAWVKAHLTEEVNNNFTLISKI